MFYIIRKNKFLNYKVEKIMVLKRKTSVAGSFYPRYKPDLIEIIEQSFLDKNFGVGKSFKCENLERRSIYGGVSPHAGYIYSGACASHTYFNLFKEKIPDSVIVLGTTHTGYRRNALLDEGTWETPLGDMEIDSELANIIVKNSKKIIADQAAYVGFPHGREHNIEVQLPFIMYCSNTKSKLVPITIGSMNFIDLKEIAVDIANSIKEINKDIIIIASSDMTHKQPRNIMNPKADIDEMKRGDQKVIDSFRENKPESVFNNATSTTVCGPQTITTLILICNNLDVKTPEILKYYTSYDKGGGTGPCEYSVGYFSGIMKI
jgi:AmmeMemoRadiSam system protein B